MLLVYVSFLLMLCNPIPVFIQSGLTKIGNSDIYETDYKTGNKLEIYRTFGNDIYEYDYNTNKGLKIYRPFGNDIYEYDYNTNKGLKIYRI